MNSTLTRLSIENNLIGALGAQSLAAALNINATLKSLDLSSNHIGAEGARSLATALDNNATLTRLNLSANDIGAQGARALATALDNNTTLMSLDLTGNNIGAEGARSLAASLHNNTTVLSLTLCFCNIGAEGARSLAAALHINTTLTTLHLTNFNNIGDEGTRSLAAALDTDRTLQLLTLDGNTEPDILNLVADRLRVNQLARNVPAWVSYAVARLREVPGHLGMSPAFAECAAMLAMLAFGDELLVLPDDNYKWRTPGGREFAATYLLPLAEAALRPRLSGWPARLARGSAARSALPALAHLDMREMPTVRGCARAVVVA